MSLRLVIFDVDGTLVDSQADILGAMSRAFESAHLPAPTRQQVLGIIGLSLPEAIGRLAPTASPNTQARIVEGYKHAYVQIRAEVGAAQSSPLYPGARAVLDALHDMPDVLLGVATGKSKRGLDKLIEAHDLAPYFATQQVADFHPSKPHPSMVLEALADTGVSASDAVMVGDTRFDMDMALSAGVKSIGVSWGYHPVSALTGAEHVLDTFEELVPVLTKLWSLADE